LMISQGFLALDYSRFVGVIKGFRAVIKPVLLEVQTNLYSFWHLNEKYIIYCLLSLF
jgi:hypothetical protein